jgi:hypothetical protein
MAVVSRNYAAAIPDELGPGSISLRADTPMTYDLDVFGRDHVFVVNSIQGRAIGLASHSVLRAIPKFYSAVWAAIGTFSKFCQLPYFDNNKVLVVDMPPYGSLSPNEEPVRLVVFPVMFSAIHSVQ